MMPTVYEGTRTFTFRYTVTDMVSQYADTNVFYFKHLSNSFEMYVKKYDCRIEFPQDMTDAKAWLHCEADGANYAFDGNAVTISAEKIPAETQVEIRSVMPKGDYAVKKVSASAKKDAIEAQELQWKTDWDKKMKRRNILAVLDVVLCVLFILIGVAYAIFAKKLYYKTKEEYPPYVRELQPSDTPAEMGNTFYYYDGGVLKKNLRGRMLSATILDFARRNILDIIPDAKEDYRIDVHGLVPGQSAELKEHESSLYSLLSRVQA